MRGETGTGGRLTLALSICAIFALILAACGSSESDESTSTGQSRPAEAASGENLSRSEARALAGMRASVLHFGKAATKAEAKAAAMPVGAFFLDRDHKLWGAACSYLSAEMRKRTQQIGGPGSAGCGKGVEALTATATTAEGESIIVAVKGLRRDGDQGFLIYATEAGKTNAILITLEAGKWKLSGVNPTPLFS